MRRNLLLMAVLLAPQALLAQVTIKSSVIDKATQQPLVGVTVIEVDRPSNGVATDVDGNFSLKVSDSKDSVTLSYLNYKSQVLSVAQVNSHSIIELEPDVIGLNDVVVTSSIARTRHTPVASFSVEPLQIEQQLGTKDLPEMLNSTPGIYATKQGGGYGDTKVNLRGFTSANVAVMVNGVPMNDMEWGGVYWSNWAGLSDVTRTMQVQRGLGASKVSSPSVGGSINIITKTVDAKKGGSFSYGMGNDGYNKIVANFSTGLMENGWAMSFLLGKTWGDGYVQGTEFEAYNYFVNLTKRFNSQHQLSFTAFGAPQWHNQRSSYDGFTIEGWQEVKNYMNGESAYKYNATYGYGLNGERKTSAYNAYHKPQISLNHIWEIDEKSNLTTSVYTSIGHGYGYSGQGENRSDWYGSSYGTLNTTYRNEDGTFDYAGVYELNASSNTGSLMAMSKSVNDHIWVGGLSTYSTKLNDKLDFYGGLDLRYYKGTHTNILVDLYGGDYYIDSSREDVDPSLNSAAANGSFASEKLQVGDVVYRDYDGFVLQEGLFTQLEYSDGRLSAFASASLSQTNYWRYDRYYYDAAHAKSDVVSFWGFTAKAGLNYNIDAHHNVFVNGGVISRAPFLSGGAFLQSTVSNLTNPNAVNEKIYSLEAGYGYRSEGVAVNVNGYYTMWKDKTMTKSTDFVDADGNDDRAILNMEGVNARHMGVELDFKASVTDWLDVTGMASIGDWIWSDDATGYFYNSNGQPLADSKGTVASGIMADDHAKMTLVLDGVKVGGSAQTTAALGVNVRPFKGFRAGLQARYIGNNYSDWSFSSSDLSFNGTKTYSTPWVIPSAVVCDLNASYNFNLGKYNATFSGNIDNVFNQEYITDATNGSSNDWDTAYYIFYGFGRTTSVRLKIYF
ncbi:MAG: TonB-dependent receptor plug domain-containing protein [Rikenellaceae bacterium]